jgi:hypothetical protein
VAVQDSQAAEGETTWVRVAYFGEDAEDLAAGDDEGQRNLLQGPVEAEHLVARRRHAAATSGRHSLAASIRSARLAAANHPQGKKCPHDYPYMTTPTRAAIGTNKDLCDSCAKVFRLDALRLLEVSECHGHLLCTDCRRVPVACAQCPLAGAKAP